MLDKTYRFDCVTSGRTYHLPVGRDCVVTESSRGYEIIQSVRFGPKFSLWRFDKTEINFMFVEHFDMTNSAIKRLTIPFSWVTDQIIWCSPEYEYLAREMTINGQDLV